MCVGSVCSCAYYSICVETKEEILESVLLFLHVGSKDGTQACQQVKCLHPLSDLASLQDINFKSSTSLVGDMLKFRDSKQPFQCRK